jgi:hypothetical protein
VAGEPREETPEAREGLLPLRVDHGHLPSVDRASLIFQLSVHLSNNSRTSVSKPHDVMVEALMAIAEVGDEILPLHAVRGRE